MRIATFSKRLTPTAKLFLKLKLQNVYNIKIYVGCRFMFRILHQLLLQSITTILVKVITSLSTLCLEPIMALDAEVVNCGSNIPMLLVILN